MVVLMSSVVVMSMRIVMLMVIYVVIVSVENSGLRYCSWFLICFMFVCLLKVLVSICDCFGFFMVMKNILKVWLGVSMFVWFLLSWVMSLV